MIIWRIVASDVAVVQYKCILYHWIYISCGIIFRLGIQKAEEAIENSIGACADIKLENKGDLSFFAKQEDVVYKKPTDPNARQKKPQTSRKKKEVKKPPVSKKTAKKLLGELYADKEYFQKLMEDQEFVKRKAKNNHIYQVYFFSVNRSTKN